jgi:hypothetical protein
VMQGALLPGLDRLPGVVTYLLERRAASGAAGTNTSERPGSAGGGAPGGAAGTADRPAAEAPAPWLEITPTLTVAGGGGAMVSGGADGATLRGRHLLDVLTDGVLRNAAVQGLGELGPAVGAETTVPTPGHGALRLTRLDGGSVRVTLAVR